MSIYKFLNPGEDCENIRPGSSSDIQEEFYNSLSMRKRPLEEFFIVLCHLRRGFSERQIVNLCDMAQSTLCRIFIPWINFMYLIFGQTCIGPSKKVIQQTMPADFKKFPITGVIIHCTVDFCEMTSSLVLNSNYSALTKNTDIKRTCWNFPKWCKHFCQPTLHREYFRQGN